MIESLNRDPFDAVFFFEEEFNKTEQCTMMYFYEKDLIIDVLKYNFGNDIDISNLKMRGSSIWKSKKEEKSNNNDPIFRVWFVTGVYLNEEILKKKPSFILYFPTVNARIGDLIILEDFFKYFFGHKLYIYFDQNGNIIPLQQNEECMFELQTNFILDFANLLRSINEIDKIYLTTNCSYIKLIPKKFPGYLSKCIHIDFPLLITLASIRRWLRLSITHLMSSQEFDKKVIIPFLASFLHSHAFYLTPTIDWKQPVLVKAVANLVIEMMNILESARLRNLDKTRRHIEFSNSVENLDPSLYCDVKEMEGIINNVREEESSREISRYQSTTQYPWK